MHGEWWLEDLTLSIFLFCIAFYLLYRILRTKKQYRYHQQNDHNDVQRVIFGRKIIDTSTGWLLFTSFIALTAIGAHFLAEYTFHLYDTTPIDKFTHGLSGMAITALVLNFYLTRKRKLYYFVAIGASWIGFVLWEVYELVAVATGFGGGYIQTEPMDLAIDLWVDSLGALAVCFLYDEFSHD